MLKTYTKEKDWLSEYMADAPLGIELPYDLENGNELEVSSYHKLMVCADELPKINSNHRYKILKWLSTFVVLLSRYNNGTEVCLSIEDNRLSVTPLVFRASYKPHEKIDERIERLEKELQSVAEYLKTLSPNDIQTLMPCQAMVLSKDSKKQIPAHVRIALYISDDGTASRLYLDRSRFSTTAAERIATHLKRIYQSFENGLASSVATIPLLDPAERQKLLINFSGQGSELPVGIVHHLFLQQAEQTPHRNALVASDRTITFAELLREANYLAQLLVEQGIRPDIRVGVCLPRTSYLVVGLMGVLMSGGCYVPLDPEYPDDRLSYMLDDADCTFVLVNQQTEAKIKNLGYSTLLIPEKLPNDWLSSPISTELTPSNLAYIIYTSGSTGQPKGIAIEHRSVYGFLCWASQIFSEAERAGMLAATSICFDLSIFEIFTPLCKGGTVHLVANVLSLVDYTQRDQIRLVNTVPSAMAALLSLGSLPTSVTTVNLAGEAFPSYLAKALWNCKHVERILNLYGPSEDTTYSTWAELSLDDLTNPPIGRPLPGTISYVLDSFGQLLPIGVPGELYLGGAGLARGYWGKKEQTVERFLSKTFDNQSPIRLYRTGDRVRFRSDGTLEHLGRLDEQVKIRGFRIELNEISSVLVAFPTIKEAITIVRKVDNGNQQLVAYYVATGIPDRNSVVAWLRKRLPHYMMPSSLMQLPELPKTLNDKIDKKRLPVITEDSTIEINDRSLPQDPVERVVLQAWIDIIGGNPEKHHNFFVMGGNSLQAVQIVAQIQDRLQIVIPLNQFFKQPTLEGLLAIVKNSSMVSPNNDTDTSNSDNQKQTILTSAERRLWIQQQFDPADTSYLLTAHLHLEGDIEIPALIEALKRLLKQHKSLRRTIVLKEGFPHPVLLPVESVPIIVEQVVNSADTKSAIISLSEKDNSRPLKLDREAPTRIRILPVKAGVVEILFTVHHVSFDDWSLKILAQDLVATYKNPSSLQASKTSINLVDAELALSKTPSKQAAIDRWVQQIGNMSFDLRLGDVLPKQTPRSNAGAVYNAPLSAEASQVLTKIAQDLKTTKFAVFMAVFQCLIWLETETERFLVGLALAGRSRIDIENTIGCFINMLPLAAGINSQLSFKSLVKEVSQEVFELIVHQDLPLEHWIEALRKSRPSDSHNIVKVACGAHNARQGEPICGEKINASANFLPTTKARLDLTLWMEEKDDRLDLLWTYATDLFTRENVVHRHRKFEQLLMKIGLNQETSLQELASTFQSPLSAKTHRGTLTMTSNKSPRRFNSRISLKPKQKDDFVQVDRNWLDSKLPLLIKAKIPGISLAEWIGSRQDALRQDIVNHGGILFRGFSLNNASEFSAAAHAFAPDLLDYREKSSPRTLVNDRIYTSTDHPADQPIFLHSEQSYTLNWPIFIMFFCQLDANQGGRTPIADNRQILKHLPDKIVERFAEQGILYVRNYLPGISLSWQDVFQTNDRREVEQFCQQNQISWEWMGQDRLRTWQRRSAFQIHPVSAERLWFNHGVFFHATSLLPQVRDALLEVISEENLPYNTYYGDGSTIDNDTLEVIRAAIAQETVRFDWHRGDLLILDNMLTQHGREPYQGSRQILTAMATQYRTLSSPIVLETPPNYVSQLNSSNNF